MITDSQSERDGLIVFLPLFIACKIDGLTAASQPSLIVGRIDEILCQIVGHYNTVAVGLVAKAVHGIETEGRHLVAVGMQLSDLLL